MKKIELVTKDELEIRLGECLEQRQMPDYFLYLDDSGVRNWLALDSSAEFTVASRLTDFLRQNLPTIAAHISSKFDMVSIGVGNGEKERLLLEVLGQRLIPTYYAVDISSEMVDQALNAVAHINVEKTGVVAFLKDLPRLRQLWNPPVLLCLLGNNFGNYDPDYLLGTVQAQLQDDDLFLFDCHLFPSKREEQDRALEQMEQTYHSPLNVRFNLAPLIQRGVSPDDCAFHLHFLPVETSLSIIYQTKKWIEILKDTTVSCGPKKVLLRAGDTISMGFTTKYTPSQVQGYLRRHGFQEVALFLSPDEDNLLALVRKQPTWDR